MKETQKKQVKTVTWEQCQLQEQRYSKMKHATTLQYIFMFNVQLICWLVSHEIISNNYYLFSCVNALCTVHVIAIQTVFPFRSNLKCFIFKVEAKSWWWYIIIHNSQFIIHQMSPIECWTKIFNKYKE